MKINIRFQTSLFLAVLVLLLASSVSTLAQEYYVIIGSFSSQSNASKFSGYARNQHYDADFFFNESKNLFYVYILNTRDKKTASDLVLRLRSETEFTDAWVLTRESIISPSTQPLSPAPSESKVAESQQPTQVPTKSQIPEKPLTQPAAPGPEVINTPSNAEEILPVKARGKFFTFQLVSSDGQPIEGKVYNVDRSQGRDLANYTANTRVDVLKPIVPGTPITLVCEIFGYKEAVKVMDFDNPTATDGIQEQNDGTWLATFTLERLRKGDLSVMYDVSFYKDAVIMTPESQGELDELVNLMKLNLAYRIKIHGHTNGNEKDLRIIKQGSDKNNYFSMSGTSYTTGSAKDLSRMRAETIQNYLIDHGIASQRMETYAWGGTAMMVKPGTKAATRLNNRIEIEILED
jgi:outer membrane protein OmpA-like peptidoglycan-associated protein